MIKIRMQINRVCKFNVYGRVVLANGVRYV
jgi:hypothetical protein